MCFTIIIFYQVVAVVVVVAIIDLCLTESLINYLNN